MRSIGKCPDIPNFPFAMRFETLRELYLHSIDSFGPRPCFSMYGGESLTYAEFSERVNTLIDIFVHAGLSSGDKIALLSNNMPNWGVAYFPRPCRAW